MSLKVTVLNNEEKFCTLVGGELQFWRIIEGVPKRMVTPLMPGEDWTLDNPVPPNLRLTAEGQASLDSFWYWVGNPGGNAVGQIMTTRKVAQWLTDTYGGITQ